MTWAEFKAAVEKAGVEDADVIWFIDTHPDDGFTVKRTPNRWRDEKLGVYIS